MFKAMSEPAQEQDTTHQAATGVPGPSVRLAMQSLHRRRGGEGLFLAVTQRSSIPSDNGRACSYLPLKYHLHTF